jgi:hypothetical protein
MFNIGNVADTVVEICGMVNKDIDTVWKYYIHELVKEGHSLEEVKAYIEHKQELDSDRQGGIKGCSGECDFCPDADDCEQCGSV